MERSAKREAVRSVEPLPGWLLADDAMKIYELARRAGGPILEIGTYRGKSTILIATALRDAGAEGPVVTLDVDREGLREAAEEAVRRGLEDRIVFAHGTSETLFRARPAFAPAFVFLDGDHSRRGVARDLRALRDRVPAGGALLFHDFHDDRNADPSEPDYGVTQAVASSWAVRDCEFGGIFGCCGLYQRHSGPSRDGGIELPTGPQIVDLGREPLSSWIERRVVGGLQRRLRR
jgi:predicted O-methyltransferase YrrM